MTWVHVLFILGVIAALYALGRGSARRGAALYKEASLVQVLLDLGFKQIKPDEKVFEKCTAEFTITARILTPNYDLWERTLALDLMSLSSSSPVSFALSPYVYGMGDDVHDRAEDRGQPWRAPTSPLPNTALTVRGDPARAMKVLQFQPLHGDLEKWAEEIREWHVTPSRIGFHLFNFKDASIVAPRLDQAQALMRSLRTALEMSDEAPTSFDPTPTERAVMDAMAFSIKPTREPNTAEQVRASEVTGGCREVGYKIVVDGLNFAEGLNELAKRYIDVRPTVLEGALGTTCGAIQAPK